MCSCTNFGCDSNTYYLQLGKNSKARISGCYPTALTKMRISSTAPEFSIATHIDLPKDINVHKPIKINLKIFDSKIYDIIPCRIRSYTFRKISAFMFYYPPHLFLGTRGMNLSIPASKNSAMQGVRDCQNILCKTDDLLIHCSHQKNKRFFQTPGVKTGGAPILKISETRLNFEL